MPRSAAGHRHVVTGQALGMLLNVLRDRLRKPDKARNRSAKAIAGWVAINRSIAG